MAVKEKVNKYRYSIQYQGSNYGVTVGAKSNDTVRQHCNFLYGFIPADDQIAFVCVVQEEQPVSA